MFLIERCRRRQARRTKRPRNESHRQIGAGCFGKLRGRCWMLNGRRAEGGGSHDIAILHNARAQIGFALNTHALQPAVGFRLRNNRGPRTPGDGPIVVCGLCLCVFCVHLTSQVSVSLCVSVSLDAYRHIPPLSCFTSNLWPLGALLSWAYPINFAAALVSFHSSGV